MSFNRRTLVLAATLGMLPISAALANDQDNKAAAAPVVVASSAVAELKPTEGSTTKGRIIFRMEGDSVKVTGNISGLKPNSEHGFHVHEKGDCSAPDASSAKGHFQLEGQKHGAPGEKGVHVGDMGNISTDANGVATVDLSLPTSQMTLGEGAHNIIGRGLIVHKDRDDLKTQPTGNAGGRAACAVITAAR